MQLKLTTIKLAMEKGDKRLIEAINDIREHEGIDIAPFEIAAKKLIYGEDGKSGIAAKLAASQDTDSVLKILEQAMQTFSAQESKTVGQLARSYTYGFTNMLKALEPNFASELKRTIAH